jgi:ABC-type glutathione transport system ATPase component
MLDPSTQAVILRELKSLQHRKGFSMLFITHDINLARKIADRVFVLEKGRMVGHGAVFEMLGFDAEISGSRQNPGRNKRAVNDHYRV